MTVSAFRPSERFPPVAVRLREICVASGVTFPDLTTPRGRAAAHRLLNAVVADYHREIGLPVPAFGVRPPRPASSVPFESPLPRASSFAQLEECKVAGPPPPRGELTHAARLSNNRFQTTAMTSAIEWWTERYVEPYIQARQRRWASTTTTMARGILLGLPRTFARARVTPPPTTPSDVAEDHLRALRESAILSPNALALYLNLLRGLLRYYECPLADDRDLWRVAKTDLGKRRWLEPPQALALWNATDERERVLVGLGLLAGARRIEMMRLHVRDLDFTLPTPTIQLLGKGMKWRPVDMAPALYAVLLSWTHGKAPNDRVWPWSETEADRALQRAARRSGAFPVNAKGYAACSWHDLRRTFIRQALETHKLELWEVAELVGHESTDMTRRYAGLNRSKARAGLVALEIQLGVAR